MTRENHRIDALPPGSALQSYIVDRVLGSGAFGITYLVKHRHLDSWHVIKEYLPDCGVRENNRSTVSPKSAGDKELFDWGLKCFFDEAKLLYQLSHPHVVKVTDLFDANGTAYFVMPHLQGITMHEWMKNNPRPGQSELEAIFFPLLEGLKYIHDKGLLHRDIKPENIFITDNTNPVLIDFGSARIAIGQKSQALTQILTPHFAPIEQYRSKGTFTPALDLYGIAACMYQAITGKLPEEAPNRLEEDEQPRLVGSKYEKSYAPHFLQAIDKSLNVYAKDRHQDGFAMQKGLVWYSGEVIQLKEEHVFVEDLGRDKERDVKQSQWISAIDTERVAPGTIWVETLTGMEFVWVPGGTFEMGDVFGDGDDDEKPVHTVELDGFWLGKYPVTRTQWNNFWLLSLQRHLWASADLAEDLTTGITGGHRENILKNIGVLSPCSPPAPLTRTAVTGVTIPITAWRDAFKEYKMENDVEVLVIRQHATKTSGYHTKPSAASMIFNAGLNMAKTAVRSKGV